MLLRTEIKCKNKNTRQRKESIFCIHAKCLTMANKKTTNKQKNLD